jgi:hypothetical protein
VLLRFPTTSVRLFESVAELRTPPFEVQYAIERYKIEYLGLAGNGGVSLQELDKLVVAKMMDSQVKDMGLCNFANPADDVSQKFFLVPASVSHRYLLAQP